MRKFIVQINMRSGPPKFVAFNNTHHKPSLVISKQKATQMESSRVAEIVSGYFWENFWDDEIMDSRTVTDIRKKS